MPNELGFSKKVKFDFDEVTINLEFDVNENTISSEISQTSSWEPWQLQLYPIFLHNENSTFVDIGANVGVNSIFAKAKLPNARVIAVEPDQRNLAFLNGNIQNAKLEVEVYPIAISDRNDFITMVGDTTNVHIGNENDVNGKRIDSQQLDTFVRNASISSIELLKIDVEGYADMVLSFSNETLKMTLCAIVEFSLDDLDLRFHQEKVEIRKNIEKVFNKLTSELKNTYYISRTEGLVSVGLAEFTEVLQVEYTVGDFLFSRIPQEAISIEVYLLRKIRKLQTENHLRILEVNSLTQLGFPLK